MATPPTRVTRVTPTVGYGSTTITKTSPTFDVVNGDLVTILAIGENNSTTLSNCTWTGTGTVTLRETYVVSAYCSAYVWTIAVTATNTGRTVSIDCGNSADVWSFDATVWRDHGGLGVTGQSSNVGGTPSISLTCSANSAVTCASGDWNAIDGTSRTWLTVNGSAMTEQLYYRDTTNYAAYQGYRTDVGSAGSKTLGLSAPGGQRVSIVGVEVLGTTGGGGPTLPTFRSQGTTPTGVGAGTGSTSVTPAVPAGMVDGDYCVIFAATKPDTATIGTPANWTLIATDSGGGGTTGTDAGPTKMAAFGRVKDATWSTMPAISITSGNSSWAQAFCIQNATGAWSVAGTSGTDSTTGTAWSVTTAANPGLQPLDYVIVGSSIPTDISTPAQFTAEAVSATGVSTWGTVTERSEPESTTGQDIGGFVFETSVTTGTASAAPVVTGTANGTTTNVRGVSILVRLREEVATIQRVKSGSDIILAKVGTSTVAKMYAGSTQVWP